MLSKMLLLTLAVLMSGAQAFTLENIDDGIYVHHGQHLDIDTGYQGDICNLSVIVGSQGIAVIDTGGSLKVGQQLREAIKKISDKPILYIINTHVHPDHIYGNAAFLQESPTVIGHQKLANTMQLRQEAYKKLNQKYLGADAAGSQMIFPTMQIEAPTQINLGDRVLTITPYETAHTNTDLTVLDSKTSTLFTGDLLFIERTPVVEGDIKGLIAVLEKLKNLPVKQVVPGHGQQTRLWQTAIDNELRYLNAVLGDIRKIIKSGGSLTQAMDTAAQSEKNNWLLFDVANRRNINTIYPALEWE
jgi:quinoprotein relay system zinc metallohydrolase 2